MMSSASEDELVFRVLGPIEVIGDLARVRIPTGRRQIVLGVLLLAANRVVGTEQLVATAWQHAPSTTARAQLDACVAALRREFDRAGVDVRIESRDYGHVLRVAPDRIDLNRFQRLVADAEVAASERKLVAATGLLGSALALWRGPAFGGAVLRDEAVRFEEQRLCAQEERIDLELRLGRHDALIGELRTAVAACPLRERPRGQLMLALYRAGRPAEALEVYRGAAELGLEPGDRLTDLAAAIRLDQQSADPVTVVRPRQLPAAIGDFVGRDALVARAQQLLGDGVVHLAGEPGIGATTLAVHVAHRVVDVYPDGQLFTRLRGADPGEVLGRFMSAMGAVGSTLPDDVGERAEMFRSMLTHRRVLIVLDDAESAEQLAPLLPGSAACGVIVTGRAELGVSRVDIGPLSPAEALELVGCNEIVDVAGGNPLALRVLAACPKWTGDVWSAYRQLDPRTQDVLRLISVLDVDTLPSWVADAVTDENEENEQQRPGTVRPRWENENRRSPCAGTPASAFARLADARLLEVAGEDVTGRPRYRCHDVIRWHARQHVGDAEAVAAFSRVAGGWLALAEQAHERLYGGPFTVLHGTAERWHPQVELRDPLEWLESERANLCAAVHQAADLGLDELCWDLAVTLVTLFETRAYWDDWQRTHHRALEAVRAAGNRRGTAVLLCSLGSLHLSQRRGEAARAVLAPALDLFAQLDDVHGLAMTRRNLGYLAYTEGRPELATRMFEESLIGFERVGDVAGQAYTASQLAQLSLDKGEHDLAVARLREALGMFREIRSPRVESQVLYRLGSAMLLQGRYEQSQQLMTSVLGMVQRNGDTVGESYALHSLGLIRGRLRRFAEAERSLRRAIRLCEENLDRVGAARIRLDLAQLVAQQGETFDAVAIAEQALATFRELRLTRWAGKTTVVLDKIRAEDRVWSAEYGA